MTYLDEVRFELKSAHEAVDAHGLWWRRKLADAAVTLGASLALIAATVLLTVLF